MTAFTLPSGFKIRPLVLADAPAVAELIAAVDAADGETNTITAEELLADWERAEFNPATDAWVAVTSGNNGRAETFVAYEEIINRHKYIDMRGDGYVHPDFRGLGLGTAMLRKLETRAREMAALAPPGLRVTLRNGVSGADPDSHTLHENEGYHVARYFWTMRIDLQAAPPAPSFPEGIILRTFGPDLEMRAVFETLEDAFRDHWGFTPWDYDWWHRRNVDVSYFDPQLVLLAMQGDEIAGVSFCRVREDKGWVSSLGVRQPWRRQGIALALLQASFGVFYERGFRRVELGVDASNPTGATKLYNKAGMRQVFEYRAYEKELRSGQELSAEERELDENTGEK